ncbi:MULTISPECIES: hypothetical protein [Microbacterium]|uniref:hypothetical protein n=1 Tax=Microbacterium TaxID=33882 RepID=UPI002786A0C6|nr:MULTISPECIES: hypothetical protein [Microbacterium]MDQ1083915.1 ElaB/YqjD/DUF883 family membrane-anchored ribosome-binding protein [Microbacterium sp. SORGH_AS_0344]MDQ1170805.1 ElaB/YqjD/DUF883 family membrane-anchored ribosome-binding protein [Microbacterium proteolyticum]
MAKLGRPSSIATRSDVNSIILDLDAGIAYERLSTKYGVSTSALSRFNLARNAVEENVQSGRNPVTDVVSRLVEAADDAQSLRRHTALTGAPLSRARSIKAEADILLNLVDRLGITDTSIADVMRDAESIMNATAEFVREHPSSALPLIESIAKHPELAPLADALRRLISPRRTGS